MRAAAWLVAAIGTMSALAGIAIAIVAFEPIPFADSIDFFRSFFAAGGWDGYGLGQLYARHNEHRLVVPRLWFLLDIRLFSATQASLIVAIVLSAVAHAAALVWAFARLGHRGPLLWAFAAAAVGAVLSPAQWENLVWSFQVQFVQVWLFATLAFIAVVEGEKGLTLPRAAVAVACGLASTYSMANGILVWPILVFLALWRGARGGALWLLIACAVAVIGTEAMNYQPHAGHGDPLQTIRRPVALIRYLLRYLTSGVATIGTTGQEILGGGLVTAWAGFAVHALVRRDHCKPAHAVLIAVAGFVVGAGLLTALGRVTFGLGQANAARYATPSLVFMTAVLALALDRLASAAGRSGVPAALAAGGTILLVPGLVDGGMHLQSIVDHGNARRDAIVGYASAGYRPGTLGPIYPAEVPFVRTVLDDLSRHGLGPFAEPSRASPPADLLAAPVAAQERECEGGVSVAADPTSGPTLKGWFAAPFAAEPRWVLAIDGGGRVVAWGAAHFDWRRLGKSLGRGSGRWSFQVVAAGGAGRPSGLVVVFGDAGSCRIASDVPPTGG